MTRIHPRKAARELIKKIKRVGKRRQGGRLGEVVWAKQEGLECGYLEDGDLVIDKEGRRKPGEVRVK